MNQELRVATDAFTCQRCGRAVRLRADGPVGAVRCGYCGGTHVVGAQPTNGDRTHIEVEPGDDAVFGPNYGFE